MIENLYCKFIKAIRIMKLQCYKRICIANIFLVFLILLLLVQDLEL